jgi:hypothetical protein
MFKKISPNNYKKSVCSYIIIKKSADTENP